MVKINRVYTGGGDKGESSLVDGTRAPKNDLRFEVVGTCDELNSCLGVVLMEIARLPDHDDGGNRNNVKRVRTVAAEAIQRVQHELFDLGAELACPLDALPDWVALISQEQSDLLVDEMDSWLKGVSELTSFILPGGSAPVAFIHIARTVARRLERGVVHLARHPERGGVRAETLVYLNRLSDWLFTLGRWMSAVLNDTEPLWIPLGQRPAERGVAHRVEQMRKHDDDFSTL